MDKWIKFVIAVIAIAAVTLVLRSVEMHAPWEDDIDISQTMPIHDAIPIEYIESDFPVHDYEHVAPAARWLELETSGSDVFTYSQPVRCSYQDGWRNDMRPDTEGKRYVLPKEGAHCLYFEEGMRPYSPEGWIRIQTNGGDSFYYDDTLVSCSHPAGWAVDLQPERGGTVFQLLEDGYICAPNTDEQTVVTDSSLPRVELYIDGRGYVEMREFPRGVTVVCTMSDKSEQVYEPSENSQPEFIDDAGAICRPHQ